jgi:hypothetical protein
MKRLALVMVLVAGCGGQKPEPQDDFSDLDALDQKSDAFSAKLRLLGALEEGTPRRVYYTPSPTFRGYTVSGDGPLDVWVRAEADPGDAVAWLLDGKFKVLKKNDDADASTYDAHLTGTLTAGKSYYVVLRDYGYAHGWFDVTRDVPAAPASQLACTGSGRIGTIPDECMDDGGANAVGDSLEIYCVHSSTRFCLSGEACPWRNGSAGADDGKSCSHAGLGTSAESDQYGLDFMAHATCNQWRGHEWYSCSPDGQIRFATDHPN